MNGEMKLVEAAAKQGQYILRKSEELQSEELHPFAMLLDKKGKVHRIELTWQEEFPDSRELAVALEAVIKVQLRFESIACGIICTDVMQRDKNNSHTNDALWIKLLLPDKIEHYYQDYVKSKRTFVFGDLNRKNVYNFIIYIYK